MYVVARLDRNDQFNELLPFAAIDVEPCECSASTDPVPLPDKLRFAVDGNGVVAAGAEAWFAVLREGAAAVLREGGAVVAVFVGDWVCGSAPEPVAPDALVDAAPVAFPAASPTVFLTAPAV
jgi:hypothetical protein